MKLNTIFSAALLMLAATACQNDNEPDLTYQNDPDAVRINPIIVEQQSRVNTQGNGDTWTLGDQIKVTITSENAVKGKDTGVFKYTDSSWNIQGDSYLVWPSHIKNDPVTFQSFYPYFEEKDNSYTKFQIPSNQSSAKPGQNFIGNADWMRAESVSYKNSEVDLSFSHQLVKVNVSIKKYNGQYATNIPAISTPKFTLPKGSNPTGLTINVENNATQIYGLMQSDNSAARLHTFTAIVKSGKYNANDNFLTLNVNGKELNIKAGKNSVLTESGLRTGLAYNFDLTMGKDDSSQGTIGTNVTITDWGESDWSDGEHGGIADEVPVQ